MWQLRLFFFLLPSWVLEHSKHNTDSKDMKSLNIFLHKTMYETLVDIYFNKSIYCLF